MTVSDSRLPHNADGVASFVNGIKDLARADSIAHDGHVIMGILKHILELVARPKASSIEHSVTGNRMDLAIPFVEVTPEGPISPTVAPTIT